MHPLVDRVREQFYGTVIDDVWDAVERRDAGRLGWLAALAMACWPGLVNPQAWVMFLNKSAMVWIHEGGHGAFMWAQLLGPVGRFVDIAAGSGAQVALPVMFLVGSYRAGFRYEASLMGFWVALNLVDVSIYAGDARARVLPLIMGLGPESHDWWNMLTMLHLLWATPYIAGAIWLLGLACYLGAIAGGFAFSRKGYDVRPV